MYLDNKSDTVIDHFIENYNKFDSKVMYTICDDKSINNLLRNRFKMG